VVSFRLWLRRRLSVSPVIAITTVLFALEHAYYPVLLPLVLSLGLAAGWVRHRAGTVGATIPRCLEDRAKGVAAVRGDLRDPDGIIASPAVRELIDFSQPAALPATPRSRHAAVMSRTPLIRARFCLARLKRVAFRVGEVMTLEDLGRVGPVSPAPCRCRQIK
jgi:hypothetical protein